ncbi:hypothetical protein B0I31_104289 [Saccharothrix carnea]|uniref:Uncharacterized protein n=1 Tax=Saccharothrix carnea TaxID=1280637 RepID=A0A2P8IC03_SACCR|nr:hypothetical protein [Saccharothrix carnea]PSL55998.1 hypothetical protein B0I31_104289 [Saccharothrix carnea]
MSTRYTLDVRNDSTQFQDLCVYQHAVDLGVPNALSLAWLTAPAWPDTTVTFEWDLDYCFVWSAAGSLRPGVRFEARETWPADPEGLTENQVLFDYADGAYRFVPGKATGDPQLGSLYLDVLPSVPAGGAAVGIGLSHAAVFAATAQPDETLVFTPEPNYWLTAGAYAAGEVLDVEQIDDVVQLQYGGTSHLTAVLNADNTWTITTGKQATTPA